MGLCPWGVLLLAGAILLFLGLWVAIPIEPANPLDEICIAVVSRVFTHLPSLSTGVSRVPAVDAPKLRSLLFATLVRYFL
jgi:hypothetical protein